MEPQSPAKVLTIVLNWNKLNDTREVLRQLTALEEETAFDILVVDNASTDGSPEMVRREFPDAQLLETGENLGGAGGFNAGMRYALNHENPYEYIWLLDNDVRVHPGALDELMKPIMADRQIAIVGSTIRILEDPSQVMETGARIDWMTCGVLRNNEGPLDRMERPRVLEADYVAACSLLARVEAIREVGLWDPNYFIAWDDMDWGIRMKRAGWKVMATTESHVEHECFTDRREMAGPASLYVERRNSLYFGWRHCPPESRINFLRHQIRMLLSHAENLRLAGERRQAYACWRAVRDFVKLQMGKPPFEDFQQIQDRLPKPVQLAALSPAPRRIALLAMENHGQVLEAWNQLHASIPNARIDIFVFDADDRILRQKLPNAQFVSTRTRIERALLGLKIFSRYDAVAALSQVQHLFFETFLPLRLRYHTKDNTWIARRRKWGHFARLARRRVMIERRVHRIASRMAARPIPPVDYHEGIQ